MQKLIFFGLLISLTANASYTESTKIQEVLVGNDFGTKVLLELTNKPQPASGCNNNSRYSYAFDAGTESGKITLSVVLSAYVAQKEVYISGADVCNVYSGIEDMNSIRARD